MNCAALIATWRAILEGRGGRQWSTAGKLGRWIPRDLLSKVREQQALICTRTAKSKVLQMVIHGGCGKQGNGLSRFSPSAMPKPKKAARFLSLQIPRCYLAHCSQHVHTNPTQKNRKILRKNRKIAFFFFLLFTLKPHTNRYLPLHRPNAPTNKPL